MRRGVIALRVAPSLRRHARVHAPEVEVARELADRDVPAVDLLHLIHRHAPAIARYLAHIRDLSAGLRVERSLLQHESDAFSRKPPNRHDLGVGFRIAIADET